mgnify:FL=1
MIEIRYLQYFLAVAREQSITRAAESLHISQPTLSKQMMELEDMLGKQLLIRNRKQIELTEEGSFLRARAQEMLELMDKTEAAFHNEGELISGDIHLGCGETPAFGFIADVFQKLKREQPSLNLHLFSGDADTVMERLDKGLLDIGLLLAPKKMDKFNYDKLPVQDKMGVLMREEDALASLDAIPDDMLKELPLIISERTWSGSYHSFWDQTKRTDYHIAATYNLIYNATFLIKNGAGYGISLDGLVNTQGTGLVFRPIVPEQSIDIYMVTKKYQTFAPAVKLFLERLQRAAETEAAP